MNTQLKVLMLHRQVEDKFCFPIKYTIKNCKFPTNFIFNPKYPIPPKTYLFHWAVHCCLYM